jgi:3-oxoacyl-[acyl-carrier protein] reductase
MAPVMLAPVMLTPVMLAPVILAPVILAPVILAHVTACASAIGQAMTRALTCAASRGAVTHPNQPGAATLAADLGPFARAWNSDAGNPEAVARFHAGAADRAEEAPRVMVNHAGIQTWSILPDLTADHWNGMRKTNLRGTFPNMRAAAKARIAAGHGGSVITLRSGCNKQAFPRLVDCTASKAGIEQFTKLAAVELGPHGIRVNGIAPGAVATMRTAAGAGDHAATWSAVTPLRRDGTPEDLTGPLLFPIPDAAAFVTGQTLWVDGGAFSQADRPSPA